MYPLISIVTKAITQVVSILYTGKDVLVERSHDSALFPLGETQVVYNAWDESGNNNTCIITVNVQEHACHMPIDPVISTDISATITFSSIRLDSIEFDCKNQVKSRQIKLNQA